jgi:type IV secretory pathway VirB2 component (pilin)
MSALSSILRKENTGLRTRLLVHGAGIILMAAVFWIFISAFEVLRVESRESDKEIQKYLDLSKMDFGDPLDRTLFRESLDIFYNGQTQRNDSVLTAINDLRQRQFSDPEYKTGENLDGLTWNMVGRLSGMFLQFIAVYGIVLIIIYLLAQRIAVYRFIKMKQHRESYLTQALELINNAQTNRISLISWSSVRKLGLLFAKAFVKGMFLMLLFSPAYVIAYAVKTTIDTSSILFMILLGIISNGVLIHTANKFFTFLVGESRKGYVQTAIVKNLHASYEWNAPEGIPLRTLLNIKHGFRSHVFQPIFFNARFQFIPALKEHASFLITGLIIIEMALNIQGHFCYELLQQILYKQYDIAAVIIFGIFLTVKATEIVIDIWEHKEKRKYGY